LIQKHVNTCCTKKQKSNNRFWFHKKSLISDQAFFIACRSLVLSCTLLYFRFSFRFSSRLPMVICFRLIGFSLSPEKAVLKTRAASGKTLFRLRPSGPFPPSPPLHDLSSNQPATGLRCVKIVICDLLRPGLSADDSAIAVQKSAFEAFLMLLTRFSANSGKTHGNTALRTSVQQHQATEDCRAIHAQSK